MRKTVWIMLLLAAAVPRAHAAEELEDAPPLVKEEGPVKIYTRTPTPTATPKPSDDDDAPTPTPTPTPTRVGPPKQENATEMEPATAVPTEDMEDKDAPPPKPVEELKDAPPLVPSGGSSWLGPRQPLFGNGENSLLQVSSRLDIGFLAGGSVQQGFTLPSVRLTAAGSTGEFIHYRLSLGETREFSSAQLPQITPVEGYVEFRHGGDTDGLPLLAWRVGMFTPEFSPWWTPDLSQVELPDYHELDRTLLLSRDLGAQLTVRPLGDKLKIAAGVFNGSGIVTLNTNSSRAFTGSIELDLGNRKTSFAVGGSVYRAQQATTGSVNYRVDTIGTLFSRLDLLYGRIRLTGELTGGQLIDSTGQWSPFGAAGTVDIGLWRWGRFFTRAEGLQGGNTGNGLMHHYQLGPVIEFSRQVEAWILYDYLENPTSGTPQQQGVVRLRLSV